MEIAAYRNQRKKDLTVEQADGRSSLTIPFSTTGPARDLQMLETAAHRTGQAKTWYHLGPYLVHRMS